MPTSLGHDNSQSCLKWLVRNDGAVLIPRGSIVQWTSVAAGNPLAVQPSGYTGSLQDPNVDGPALPGKLSISADGAVLGGIPNYGIAENEIRVGQVGFVVVLGFAKVAFSGATTAGAIITSGASGQAGPAAHATTVNPFGMLIEGNAAGTGDLKWCIVNFLTAFVGIINTQLNFMGKAY